VKFLLATTDPKKLPVTVLSRCLQFNLTRLTPRLIQDRLAKISKAEGIDADDAALALLARAADGSLRDALSLLDQAIAFCGGKVEANPVSKMLGTIDRDHVAKLINLLAADDAVGVINAIEEIDQQFPDYSRLLEDLARILQQIAVFQVVGAIETDDDIADAQLNDLATGLTAEDVQLFYQIALMGRRDLHLAPDPRSGAEMTLLRMVAFRPASVQAATPGAAPEIAPKKSAKEQGPPADKWKDPEWTSLVAELALPGAVRLLAGNCAYLRRDGATVFLSIDPRSESLLTRPLQVLPWQLQCARLRVWFLPPWVSH